MTDSRRFVRGHLCSQRRVPASVEKVIRSGEGGCTVEGKDDAVFGVSGGAGIRMLCGGDLKEENIGEIGKMRNKA